MNLNYLFIVIKAGSTVVYIGCPALVMQYLKYLPPKTKILSIQKSFKNK